jgi:hypothetical protein
MTRNKDKSDIRKFIYRVLLFITLLMMAATLALSQDDKKVETIDSTAMGTSTQMGRTIGVKVPSISTLRTMTDNSSLMPSRRARIKVWLMHLAK